MTASRTLIGKIADPLQVVIGSVDYLLDFDVKDIDKIVSELKRMRVQLNKITEVLKHEKS